MAVPGCWAPSGPGPGRNYRWRKGGCAPFSRLIAEGRCFPSRPVLGPRLSPWAPLVLWPQDSGCVTARAPPPRLGDGRSRDSQAPWSQSQVLGPRARRESPCPRASWGSVSLETPGLPHSFVKGSTRIHVSTRISTPRCDGARTLGVSGLSNRSSRSG